MGAEFIDYIIADQTVAPFEHQRVLYREDRSPAGLLSGQRQPSGRSPSCGQRARSRSCRTKASSSAASTTTGRSLPRYSASGCGCCMRSKAAYCGCSATITVPNRTCASKLQARGIDPARLVFADRLPLSGPPGAAPASRPVPRHAALRRPHHGKRRAMGWPSGANAAGRIVCRACGGEPAQCHRTARPCDAQHRGLRGAGVAAGEGSLTSSTISQRLAENRLTHPLFDTERFRRHIEAAYLQMWEIWQRGEQPRSFAVEAEKRNERLHYD